MALCHSELQLYHRSSSNCPQQNTSISVTTKHDRNSVRADELGPQSPRSSRLRERGAHSGAHTHGSLQRKDTEQSQQGKVWGKAQWEAGQRRQLPGAGCVIRAPAISKDCKGKPEFRAVMFPEKTELQRGDPNIQKFS